MKYCYLLLTSLFMTLVLGSSGQTVTTIAGKLNLSPLPATSIGMNPPNQVADAAGNLYVADPDRHVIRKIDPSGMLTTIAGNGTFGSSGDGGAATAAQLQNPYNVAIDAAGNIYIADSYDNRIRKVAVNGIISTVAGNGTAGFSGDGGQSINAQLNGPNGIAADASGNIFIADVSNNRIRKVASNGIITTVAGNGINGDAGDGGAATSAQLGLPIGVAVDGAGNLFISDFINNRVRKVNTSGIITAFAGSRSIGFSGDNGPALSAVFNGMFGSVAADAAGNIFIPDLRNNRIRKVDAGGIVTTIAGNGGSGFSGDGSSATAAQLYNPIGVSTDAVGNVYVSAGNRIRKITVNGIINTVAGNGTEGFSGNGGQAVVAQLYHPIGVAFDAANNLVFADEGNSCVRKIDANGIITTIAGTGLSGFSGDGGPATSAQLATPSAVAMDKVGNMYITDNVTYRIRKVSPGGIITTFAGNGTRGFSGDGASATAATMTEPDAITTDTAGNVYFVDAANNRIRKIDINGIISTVAGNGTDGFSGDGGPAIHAGLNPRSVATDAAGNLFIADGTNYRIRKVSADGTISTIAGNGTAGFNGDGGNALAAQLQYPSALSIDAAGNIFVSDGSIRIREITTSGTILTRAGGGTDAGGEGVTAATAGLYSISSVVTDGSGNIYFTEFYNHRIRKVTAGTLPLTLLEFRIRRDEDNIVSNWQTTHEVNTAGFFIQRSTDGNSFITVGTVLAKGDNNGKTAYSYTDYHAAQTPANTLFYRLQMTDHDGRTTYSDVKRIDLLKQSFSFTLSPNPAHGMLYVKGEHILRIAITDNTGKQVKEQVIAGSQTGIDVSGFSKGMYVMEVFFEQGIKKTRKIAIQ